MAAGRTGHTDRMRPGHAYLDAPGPLAFAHRGGHFDGLENTMAAFTNAVSLGYQYLETDARATADGQLLAFHDPTLDRVTDRTGVIAELPWRQVRAARVGGREPIPLLEDLVAAFPDARFNLDVKHPSAIAPLVRAIQRTGSLHRVCVTSFSDRRLAAVRAALGPGLCTAMGPATIARLRTCSRSRLLRWLAPRYPCVQVPDRWGLTSPAFVAAAQALGVQVHVWTINDEPDMHRLINSGVNGIMTDQLHTLRDVLRSRGAWSSDAQHPPGRQPGA